jgi:hypothetical protein
MLWIYAGRTYRYSVRGKLSKTIVCEKCGREYSATSRAIAYGRSESYYFLDNGGARERAEQRAEIALHQHLAHAITTKACIRCGWMQQYMVNEIKRRSYHYLFWVCGIGVPFILLFSCWVMVLAQTSSLHYPLPIRP